MSLRLRGEICLLPTDGNPPMKVTAIQKNKPSQLVFLVPDPLPGIGEFYLEVRARMRDNAELRSGRLDAVLTV